jgi:hypothetical protein
MSGAGLAETDDAAAAVVESVEDGAASCVGGSSSRLDDRSLCLVESDGLDGD